MPMEIHRKALKEQARQIMRQHRPPVWLVALVFWGLTNGVSTVAGLADLTTSVAIPTQVKFLPLFFTLLLTLYGVVMAFGYQFWCLRAWRREPVGYANLIDGFGMVGRVLLMEVHIFVRTLGWSMLVMVPFVIVTSSLYSWEAIMIATWIFLLIFMPYFYVIQLRYALAPYLLADHADSWNASQAVRESVSLMRGWKMELFKLDLSFLGWYLLQWLLSVAIQSLFLLPTLMTAMGNGQMEAETLLTIFAAGTTVGSVVATLICLPLDLFLLPYTGLSRAGFYDARSKLVPPAPPVYTYDPNK